MTTEALKSSAITNLDATPCIAPTAGEGGAYSPRAIDGVVTTSASMAATSTYRMVRVKSTVKIKSVQWASAALGAGAFNVGWYYSDSTIDGTTIANQGLEINSKQAIHATDVSGASKVQPTDITNESDNWTADKFMLPLWSALGLTVDPGGYFDLVFTVHTTDITTGGRIYARVSFAD